MSHCKKGEKATVTYKFPGKAEKTYTTDKTPINVVIQPTNINGYLPGILYAAYYWVDSVNMNTGVVTGSNLYQDYGRLSPNKTLIDGDGHQYYYPPFGVPTIEWLGFTGFSQVCIEQNYRYLVTYHDVNGIPRRGYCNLLGFAERAGSQRSQCFLPSQVRDFKWTVADGQTATEPLKFEIVITLSDGTQFKDYGENEPTFKVQCGDCPENTIRCESKEYPGYCCIPCKEVATRINNLAARI